MILVPIGHEQEATRRLPWITFGTMILCAIAFAATGFGSGGGGGDGTASLQRAAEYWLEHPYLKLDAAVEVRMHGLSTREMRDTFREGLRANAPAPEDPAVVEAEQAELDALCRRALSEEPTDAYHRFGLVPSNVSPVGLLTHMFLHGGWLHLIGNLFLLYLAGPFIEDVWGRGVYAAFYLLAGIVAAMCFVLPHRDLTVPLIGASGAIAGVMGAFVIRYWRTKIRFFYAVGFFLRGTFWAPAWLMLGLWFVQQLFLALVSSDLEDGAGGGVAYAAHVGGFAFGAAIALAFRRFEVERRWLAPSIAAKVETVHVSNTEVDAALEIAAAGNVDGALERLSALLAVNPAHVDAALALWGIAEDAGRSREAAPAMARAIQEEIRKGQIDLALGHYDDLRRVVPTAAVDLRSLVRIAEEKIRRGDPEGATESLRRALLAAGSRAPAAMTLKIGTLAAGLDPRLARAAASLVVKDPAAHPGIRVEAEKILSRV